MDWLSSSSEKNNWKDFNFASTPTRCWVTLYCSSSKGSTQLYYAKEKSKILSYLNWSVFSLVVKPTHGALREARMSVIKDSCQRQSIVSTWNIDRYQYNLVQQTHFTNSNMYSNTTKLPTSYVEEHFSVIRCLHHISCKRRFNFQTKNEGFLLWKKW